MNIKAIIKSVFAPECWCCGVRFNNDDSTCVLNDRESEFIIAPNTKRYWCADPFLAKNNGKYYLFFEAFDRLQKKGVLGCREITAAGFGDIKIIYQAKGHLSFPFIYNQGDDYYIIPESAQEQALYRLKCLSFPDKWEKDKVLAKGRLVDTVMLKSGGTSYCISEKTDKSNYFDRVDLFYFENGELLECKGNPVKRDIENARGAGKLFEYNGKLIRPAQNCKGSYGESLNFNIVNEISKEGFSEERLCKISPKDLNFNEKNVFTGIHTYNRLDNIEVVDLKLPPKFSLYNFLGAFVKLVRKVF